LSFLYANLLKVNEETLVDLKRETATIGADGITANCWIGELELLLNITNLRLAIHAGERAEEKLWMNGMSAHNLAGNANESSDLCCCQFADFVARRHFGERNIAFLFLLQLIAILDKVRDGLAEEREDSKSGIV